MAEDAKDWAIVFSEGQKYVGKLAEKEEGDWVILNPCLEYLSEIQAAQGPQGQLSIIGRTRTLMPFDHTLEPCPVHVRAGTICFLSEMGEHQRKEFMGQIDRALATMEQARLKKQSNLIVTPQMPRGPLPSGQA